MSRSLVCSLITVATFFFVPSDEAAAVPIQGLFNTGVDDLGSVLPDGSLEQHYAMTGPLSPAIVATPYSNWVTPPAGSAWIGPTSGYVTDPLGTYIYTLTFDLTGLDVGTASISGLWATDNTTLIFLNGVNTGIEKNDQTQLDAFALSSGFLPGLNTLEFYVTNNPGSGGNPTGLLIADLAGTAAVPEPTTASLLALGLVSVATWRRRKRQR